MPLNVLDYHYRSFTQQILPILLKRNIGVIGMKSVGGGFGGRFLKIKSFEAQELIRYSMSLPVSVLVSGMDSLEVLESNLRIASNFVGMSEGEKSELLSRAKPFSKNGEFESYKIRE